MYSSGPTTIHRYYSSTQKGGNRSSLFVRLGIGGTDICVGIRASRSLKTSLGTTANTSGDGLLTERGSQGNGLPVHRVDYQG
ncbi:hypothetical protein TNCV_4485331 [Trichonephila clavipes]|nr:hypothetical protein TNCV_4485331 [Trichonephila clavipes]